ncbi:putative necrosis-inducing factor-domain-containing protein, partial [Copromyces sp. CBS 386.78]
IAITTLLRVTLLLAHTATTTAALPAGDTDPPVQPFNSTLTVRDHNHWECTNYRNTADQSSAKSPIWQDCITLRHNIHNGGRWTFSSGTQTRLAWYHTCAIGVDTAPNQWAGTLTKVGNIDLIKIVEMTEQMILKKNDPNQVFVDKKDGIRKVRWDARVGSKGEMDCYQWVLYNDLFKVVWGLYY